MVGLFEEKFSKLIEAVEKGQKVQDASAVNLSKEAEGQQQTAEQVAEKSAKIEADGQEIDGVIEAIGGKGQKTQEASAANLSEQVEGMLQAAEQAIEESKETGAIGKKIEQVGQNTA